MSFSTKISNLYHTFSSLDACLTPLRISLTISIFNLDLKYLPLAELSFNAFLEIFLEGVTGEFGFEATKNMGFCVFLKVIQVGFRDLKIREELGNFLDKVLKVRFIEIFSNGIDFGCRLKDG